MVKVNILGEFYLSQILGKPIYDCLGEKVGRLEDLAVNWDAISPIVTGIKFAKGLHDHIDIKQVASWDKSGIRLKGVLDRWAMRHLTDKEIYAAKWLLDRKIIDMQGSKVVQVNDIKLSWISRGSSTEVLLIAVDIGVRGRFRRMKLEFLVSGREEQLVGSQYIKPLQKIGENLHFNTDLQLNELHPTDFADIIADLDRQERQDFIENLDVQTAAEALAESDLDVQVEVISNMDKERASDILEEMPPDEAADILVELPEEQSNELLNMMEQKDANDVRELMKYPQNTSGALMTTEYIAFPRDFTAQQTINQLRVLAPDAETIYYIYVTDEDERLIGVLSLRDLIISDPNLTLQDFMRKRLVTVEDMDPVSKACELVNKYYLLALPVIDPDGHLVGIITMDDVIDMIVPDRTGFERQAFFKKNKNSS